MLNKRYCTKFQQKLSGTQSETIWKINNELSLIHISLCLAEFSVNELSAKKWYFCDTPWSRELSLCVYFMFPKIKTNSKVAILKVWIILCPKDTDGPPKGIDWHTKIYNIVSVNRKMFVFIGVYHHTITTLKAIKLFCC